MRESIYQITKYSDQKKALHELCANYMISHPGSCAKQNFPDQIQEEILKIHLLKAQDVVKENDLNIQARTGLIVQRLRNRMEKDPNAIAIQGKVQKQGDALNQKIDQNLC